TIEHPPNASASTAATSNPSAAPPASPVSRLPSPTLMLLIGVELLRRIASQQVAGRIALHAFADPAQVAHQRTQLAQGRAELRQAVVGEAADRGAVLVEDGVGAAGGRVEVGEGAVELGDQARQLVHQLAVDVLDRAVGVAE